jgi:hypothetical protein
MANFTEEKNENGKKAYKTVSRLGITTQIIWRFNFLIFFVFLSIFGKRKMEKCGQIWAQRFALPVNLFRPELTKIPLMMRWRQTDLKVSKQKKGRSNQDYSPTYFCCCTKLWPFFGKLIATSFSTAITVAIKFSIQFSLVGRKNLIVLIIHELRFSFAFVCGNYFFASFQASLCDI